MKLALIAEYDAEFEPHVQTDAAIEHTAAALGIHVEPQWLSTYELEIDELAAFDAIWFAPGSPYKNLIRTFAALQFARESDVPTFGTCGGFQHMVLEYARNVLAIHDAKHAEYDPYASRLIVSRLGCSLVGREMQIDFTPNSLIANAYGATHASERYYCNFGVNPDFLTQLSDAGLVTVGIDEAGECRAMEVSAHRFYVGTLYVPQARSRPGVPHPLIQAFFQACR